MPWAGGGAAGRLRKTEAHRAGCAGEAAAAQAIPVRPPMATLVASANPAAAQAVKPVVADYRARIKEIVERAALPHDLLLQGPALQASGGLTAGPRKPALEHVFKPMGYSCKGGSGTFTLRRRTAANLTVELNLDVGTWSHLVLPMFRALGVGFKASLMLPVAVQAVAGAQYPIGNAEQGQKIVENLGALVKELDRTFVPDIERLATSREGRPSWFHHHRGPRMGADGNGVFTRLRETHIRPDQTFAFSGRQGDPLIARADAVQVEELLVLQEAFAKGRRISHCHTDYEFAVDLNLYWSYEVTVLNLRSHHPIRGGERHFFGPHVPAVNHQVGVLPFQQL